jgi:hypothetical protein
LISYRGEAIEAKLSGIFAAGFHVVSCNARTAWRLSTGNLARFSVWSPGQDSIYDIRIQSDKAPRNALDNRITNPLEFLCICADQASWASEKAY